MTHRDELLLGLPAIQGALARMGIHYSYAWVRWACSSRYTGTPIPVRRRGTSPRARVAIMYSALAEWAHAFCPVNASR